MGQALGILVLIFLLAIILGLQIQITGIYRDVQGMNRKDEKKT